MFGRGPPAITGDQMPNRLSRVWRFFLTLHWFDGVLALLSAQLLAFAFFVDTRTRDE
jgi:hypothetical protein